MTRYRLDPVSPVDPGDKAEGPGGVSRSLGSGSREEGPGWGGG